MSRIIINCFLLLVLCVLPLASSFSQSFSQSASKLVKSKISSKSGLEIRSLDTGKVVLRHNEESPLKPASILKILTSAYALNHFGPDYQFETKLLYEKFRQGALVNLRIQGSGDPSFLTEDLWNLARILRQKGIKEIENIYLDDTAFIEPVKRQGVKPYQAGVSALAFNFNSLKFTICPTSIGQAAQVRSDPWEYKIQMSGKITTSRSKKVTYYVDEPKYRENTYPQEFILNGNIPHTYSCTDVYRNVPDPAVYLGQTFAGFLGYLGIQLKGKIYKGTLSSAKKQLYSYKSKPLRQIVEDLNKYSNNFIAEQLLYAFGEQGGSYSKQRGLDSLSKYLVNLGYPNTESFIADASGLSHDNLISARIINDLIFHSYQKQEIRNEFLNSLAVPKQIGTLKKRRLQIPALALRAKTGTINAVDSLAGVIQSKSGNMYSFAIIQNQVRSTWQSEQFENKLLELVYSKL